MNTANKLTLFRVVLVPIFMALMELGNAMNTSFMWARWAALGVFILASLTDMLDGKIARKRNQITTFGKFADPLADKLLTTAAFLMFMQERIITVWPVMIILLREFAVSGVRLAAAGEGEVIAASYFGKLKTVTQMIAIIVTIAITSIDAIPQGAAQIIGWGLVWISVIFTVLSGVDYIVKNRKLLKLK